MTQADVLPTRREVEADRNTREAVRMRTRYDAAHSSIAAERIAAEMAVLGRGVGEIAFKTGLSDEYVTALVLGELPKSMDLSWLRHRVPGSIGAARK